MDKVLKEFVCIHCNSAVMLKVPRTTTEVPCPECELKRQQNLERGMMS